MMKKLDLHIHTKQTVSDPTFSFSLDKLKEYVQQYKIDGIAITNHNIFNIQQFQDIQNKLSGDCVVLPGIEINIGVNGVGHLICITNQEDIEDFDLRCKKIEDKIQYATDKITIDELDEIFSDYSKYLWIPHYDKKPTVDKDILDKMKNDILCGEVGSVKKFIYRQKDENSLVPVYFSDLRPEDNSFLPTRQTYFDIDNITVQSIKKTLINRRHVSLTEYEGNSLFYVLPDLPISTGLNIIIGERSSGKTYLLDEIAKYHKNVKYIQQFELIEKDQKKAAKSFTDQIASKRNSFSEEYFELFCDAVNTVKDISLERDGKDIERYLSTLITYAKEIDRADMFAKCGLYNEEKFQIRSLDSIKELIDSVEKLLDTREYRNVIENHISRDSLIALYSDLIEMHNKESKRSLEKIWVNDLVETIKRSLRSSTAESGITEVDFYNCQLNRKKVKQFNELASNIKKKSIINEQKIEHFTIRTRKRPFESARELKDFSKKANVVFSKIMDEYTDNPYQYLMGLKEMDGIAEADYYKYFVCIDYQILNQYNIPISGGERAEFNLLQKIKEAYLYDMLLIDEPESSFDNLFLKARVNHIIRELAKTMPIILATHNNTVGASIKPDYLIYTKRCIDGDNVQHERYYGLPSEKELRAASGKLSEI